MYRFTGLALLVMIAACGPSSRADDDGADDDTTTADAAPPADGQACLTSDCFILYASSDHVLYTLDLDTVSIERVGPFNAPQVAHDGGGSSEDVITDLAVSPAGVIYVVSNSSLYTADASDGHVTRLGSLDSCGSQSVALSFTKDGVLVAGDFNGAYCTIDLTQRPAVVHQITGSMGGGLALAGDLVAVNDGTMYGTAYRLADDPGTGTQDDNLLVTIDPATGQLLDTIGMTGYPRLYGVAFALGKVFGFLHDSTGRVVAIDPSTGHGTVFGAFNDPITSMPILFSGAGVTPRVPNIP
jgi:hypothetical protein